MGYPDGNFRGSPQRVYAKRLRIGRSIPHIFESIFHTIGLNYCRSFYVLYNRDAVYTLYVDDILNGDVCATIKLVFIEATTISRTYAILHKSTEWPRIQSHFISHRVWSVMEIHRGTGHPSIMCYMYLRFPIHRRTGCAIHIPLFRSHAALCAPWFFKRYCGSFWRSLRSRRSGFIVSILCTADRWRWVFKCLSRTLENSFIPSSLTKEVSWHLMGSQERSSGI